jgi:hypothetical protein
VIKRWLRRTSEPGPPDAAPDTPLNAVPADLLTWAQAVDVSRLPDKVVQDAEYYLRRYRRMPLEVSQQMGLGLMAAVEAHVSPPPPADAAPLDVLATILAVRRNQLGIG